MTQKKDPEVTVVPTQADREAARKLYGSADWSQERIATHFARHRLAHQTPPATQPSAAVGRMQEALDEAHALIQEAKGFAGPGEITDHLDFAESWLDKIDLATLHTPPPVATATVVDAGEEAL